ncbi:hypothetical protein ACHQM5_010172 [Ranunculus cassubicifolius]
MDFDLKHWKVQQQQQSEELQPCAKIPRLQSSVLPFFVPEPSSSSLSAFSDSTATRFSGLGCFFSLAQRQELELQALIFKYMLVNAPIPPELLLPIKTSLLQNTSPASACYLYPYQQYQHYQQPMLHSGYWGRNLIDPEPGRCRRTDGKKWRCAREVVLGHKYCERHVHRGRNRSRKLVENATPKGDLKTTSPLADSPITAMKSGTHFSISGSSPSANAVQVNERRSEERTGNVGLLDIQNGKLCGAESGPDGQLLRQFFDDWPRSNEDSSGVADKNGGPSTTTGISISSTPSSDTEFSLKLSTGNVDETVYRDVNGGEEPSQQLDWGTGWSGHQASSMGGPLAEALRSSISNASPTSVLYELHRGTASETSSAST